MGTFLAWLVLAFFLFPPPWGIKEWLDGILTGLLFYLFTPLRELLARRLQHWLTFTDTPRWTEIGGDGQSRGIVAGVIGFFVAALVDVFNHVVITNPTPEKLLAIRVLPQAFLFTYFWAIGAQQQPSRATVYGTLAAAIGGPIIFALSANLLDPAMPLRTGIFDARALATKTVIAAIAAFVFIRALTWWMLRSRVSGRVASGYAALGALAAALVVIAGVDPGFARAHDWLLFGIYYGTTGFVGGLAIDTHGEARPSVALACALLARAYLLGPITLVAQNYSLSIVHSLPVLLPVLAVWAIALYRWGPLSAATSTVFLLGIVALWARFHPPFTWFNLLQPLLLNLGWIAALLLYPRVDDALRNLPAAPKPATVPAH